METMIDQSGLLVESDYLTLSTSVQLQDSQLFDSVTGAIHKLHPAARVALIELNKGTSYLALKNLCISNGLNNRNFEEIILFINDIGGLNIKRSVHGRLKHLVHTAKLFVRGIKPISLAVRYSVSPNNLSIAVSVTMLPLGLAIAAVAVLAYGANIPAMQIITSSLLFLTFIYISTLLHEATHALVVYHNGKNMCILRRGLRVGILHAPMTQKAEYISAVSGPAIGIFSTVILGAICRVWLGSASIMIAWLVAGMHLLSWLPGYGDGNVVWHRTKFNRIEQMK